MIYLWIKLVHIISSTLLFGTGLGTAYYLFMANRNRDDLLHLYKVTHNVVIADFIFTTPAVILQPLTGFIMIYLSGLPITMPWLIKSLILYLLIGAFWLPVVYIQIRLKNCLALAITNKQTLNKTYDRLYKLWFIAGWPAFTGVIVIFYLMVLKPG